MTQDYYQQGLAKAKAGDYRGAIAEFELAAIATPEWAEVYYRRGLARFDLGEAIAAISDYTQALSLDREHRDCYYARALARLSLKNFPGALEDIDRAIQFGRDYAPAYQLKGLVCKKLTQYPQAIDAYKQAANLYLARQDAANSRQCLEAAQSLQPKYPQVPAPIAATAPKVATAFSTPEQFYAHLLEQGERGDLETAIDRANWAVKTSPEDARVYSCRGMLYLKQGNFENALSDFSRAIQLDPKSGIGYRHRGKLRDRLGDYRGALLDFDRALEIDPQDALIYLARGNVRCAASDYPGALADFDRAVELDPSEPAVYLGRARTHAKLEELNRAIEDYQQAANIYLERADLTKYRETIACLQQLQSSSPKSNPSSQRGSSSSEDLHQRLYVLVGGHWAIAERLLDRLKSERPGQSEDWYLARVIADLERS